MKRELVAVKNREYWDIILDVSLSEGKKLSAEKAISVLKINYDEIANVEFIIEDIEIFALIDSMTTVNPGDGCKI